MVSGWMGAFATAGRARWGTRALAWVVAFVVFGALALLDPDTAHATQVAGVAPAAGAKTGVSPKAFGGTKTPGAKVASRPDTVSAAVSARAQGSAVEVKSLRSATSTTFANPDGTMTTQTAGAPIRYRDGKGDWAPVDLALAQDSDGTVAPKGTSGDLSLATDQSSATGGSPAPASDTDGVDAVASSPGAGQQVVFGWAKKLGKPVLSGTQATYAGALPGITFRVQALRTGYETFVDVQNQTALSSLLKSTGPAAGRVAVTFPVKTKGLTARAEKDGSVSFVDAKGSIRSFLAAPKAWDAKVDPASGLPASTTPVRLDVAQRGTGKATITASIDAAWAKDSARAFPVTIDPTYASATITPSLDTYVQTDTTIDESSSTELRVGTYNGGAVKARSFLNFPLAAITGKQVVSASLSLYNTYSYSCTARQVNVRNSGAASTASRWGNQPTLYSTAGSASFAKGYGSSCPAGRQAINVTDVVKSWAASGNSNGSMGLLAASETDSLGWKRFASAETSNPPQLSVTYNRAPNTAAAPTFIASGNYGGVGYVQGGKVTFSTKITDPDGSQVKSLIEVRSSTTAGGALVSSCTTPLGASGATVSCANTTDMADGGTFYVRAKSTDELGLSASSWSGWTIIKRAGTAPAAPVVSCPGYANGSWTTTTPGNDLTCTVSVSGSGTLAATALQVFVDGAATPTTTIDAHQTATSTTVTVSKKNGAHSVRAVAIGGANKSSAITSAFGWGTAAVLSPVNGSTTSGKIQVTASGQGSSTPTATLQWRLAGATDATTGWVDAAGASMAVTVASGAAKATTTWDTSTATTDASGVDLPTRTPVTLDLQVCFAYPGGATQCTAVSAPATITRVPHAFGAGYPTTDAGVGQVAQTTGELSLSDTDATVPGLAGDLSISRSHLTFTGDGSLTGWPKDSPNSIFGPGFTANLDGPSDAGTGGMNIYDQTGVDGTIVLMDEDGSVLVYRQPGGTRVAGKPGTYTAATQDTADAGMKVVMATGGLSVAVTDEDATVTTYTRPSTSTSAAWGVSTVAEPGSAGTTTYTRDSNGRVTRILGGLPDGFTATDCPGTGALTKAGCRALDITYNGTAQVAAINAVLWDPATSAMKSTPIATYTYDGSQRLTKVTDPRTNLETQYGWDGTTTRLASVTPAGLAAYRVSYDGAATAGGRVKQVTRDAATTGGSSAALFSFVYGVPVTGGASSLPSMGSSDVADWAQRTTPVTGYAVFGQEHPVSSTNPAALSTGDWHYGDLSYVDAQNYEVNTATYGAGQWLITSTDYDELGNTVRSLDAKQINVVKAWAAANPGASDADTGAYSDFYSTQTVYNEEIKDAAGAVTVAAGTRVTDTSSPATELMLPGGSTVTARKAQHTSYDQGAPSATNPATDAPWGLATTVTTDVVDNTGASLSTIDTTTTGYNPVVAGDTSGWTLGNPTTVTTGGITRTTRYDSAGRTIEIRQPAATSTASAGTARTVYYTAGANSTDSACGNTSNAKAWAGSVCRTFPGAAPSTGPTLPDARTTGYSMWLAPTSVVETSGTATRTTANSYDPAGRTTLTKTTATIPDATPVEATFTHYTAATGLVDYTGNANTAGTDATTARTSTTYDGWGRKVTYTSDTGDTATTSYDSAGRVSSVTDPKGTTSYTYDGTDAEGKEEHRSVVTGLSVTRPGAGGALTYTGAYDASGTLTTEDMPGFVTSNTITNTLGQVTGLSYTGQITPVTAGTDVDGNPTWTPGTPTTGVWMSWTQDRDAQGRVVREYTGAGAAFDGDPGIGEDGDTSQMSVGQGLAYDKAYTYDAANRLSKVTDRAATTPTGGLDPNDTASSNAPCVVRTYAFAGDPGKNGNRTGLSSVTHNDGDCAGTASSTRTLGYSHDTGDRATTAATINGAASTGSYVYDAFGRQTTIPATDTPSGATAGNATLGYYVDDSIKTLAQNGVSTSLTLDAAGRRAVQTSTTGTGTTASTTVSTRHYTDDSDNPAWVEQSTTPAGGTATSTTTRFTDSVSGSYGAQIDTTGVATIGLMDPNGNAATSITIAAAASSNTPVACINDWNTYTEFGTPSTGGTTGTGTTTGPLGYGWLGTSQRANTPATLGLTLMGARVYNPVTGRFTSTDPVPGGNDNTYIYPNDPINSSDTTGLAGLYERGNKKEKQRCLAHGRECAVNYSTSKWAEGVAQRYYPRDPNRREALRHMIWQAYLTWVLGSGSAKAWGDAHEWGSTDPRDTRRDLKNNISGRSLGQGLRNKYRRVPWNEDNAKRAAVKWALGRIRHGQFARK